jgi:hypothetical protein
MNKQVKFVVDEILTDTFVGEKSHSAKWSVGEFNLCRWVFRDRPVSISHLLWHGTSVFPVSDEGPPHSVASYDTHGDAEDLF